MVLRWRYINLYTESAWLSGDGGQHTFINNLIKQLHVDIKVSGRPQHCRPLLSLGSFTSPHGVEVALHKPVTRFVYPTHGVEMALHKPVSLSQIG